MGTLDSIDQKEIFPCTRQRYGPSVGISGLQRWWGGQTQKVVGIRDGRHFPQTNLPVGQFRQSAVEAHFMIFI